MNILVVEDTEDSRILIVDQLRARGYVVESASDGAEALEKLKGFAADVVVSDILMPVMDGYELCQRLKTDNRYHTIPLIFYTATYTDPKDRKFALSLGASGFLVKPASEEDLITLIESVMTDIRDKQIPIPSSSEVNRAEYDHIKNEVLSRKLDKRNEQLQTHREELRIITDALPVLIAEIDTDHRYTYANKTHEEWCRYPVENIVGKHMQDVLGKDAYRTIKKYLNYAGENNNREYQLPFPDGNERYITLNIKPYIDRNGKIINFICLLSDVSRIKKSEIELSLYKDHLEDLVEDRTAQLQAINSELEAFSYTVSHDLRNPIKSIEGFSLALEEELAEATNEKVKDYLKRIRNMTRRMDNLIKDLMNLSQISKKDINFEEVDLSRLANEIVAELNQSADAGKFETQIANNLTVVADAGLMRIVLENLIGNARKFSKNEVSPKIILDSYKKGDNTIFFVKDNGAGFDAKYKEKIFTAFKRLHSPSEYPGSGVGLATVKRIIHRHGGTVWATGDEGKGACFYFSIPDNARINTSFNRGGEIDQFDTV